MFRTEFFFFKQKTAYEMRISDWSSDVCSSDLLCRHRRRRGADRARIDRARRILCSLHPAKRGLQMEASARAEIAVETLHEHGISFGEAVRVWIRVAPLSFGGPAGQVAVMQRHLVREERRSGVEWVRIGKGRGREWGG